MAPAFAVLAFVATVYAHRPHSVLSALATGDEETQTWSLLDPHDVSQLMSSPNGGEHWNHEASPAMEEPLVGIAMDSQNVLYVLAQDGTLWIRPEDGAWTSEELLAQEGIAREIQSTYFGVVVATSRGLYIRDIEGSSSIMEPSFLNATSLNVTCSATCSVVVVGASGGVWFADGLDAELLPLPELPGGRVAYTAVLHRGRVVAGTQDGSVSFDMAAGVWELCGALPVDVQGAHADSVVRVAGSDDGRLLAASGHEALFVSEDSCATWTSSSTGLEVAYGGTGNATDPSQAWVHLGLSGPGGLVGGFAGVSFTNDGGSTWNTGHLLRNRYTRALAFASRDGQPMRIYSAGYGGGATWTDDGAETWKGSAVGLDEETVAYDLLVVSNDPDVVLMTGLSALYRSNDGGQSWNGVEIPMERARALDELDDGIYLLGESISQEGTVPRLARSVDQGLTWSLVESYSEAANGALAGSIRQGVLKGQATLAITTDVPAGLLVSTDSGISWDTWLELELEPSAGMEFWPPEESGRMVFASPSSGVLIGTSSDEEWWAPRTPPIGQPRRLVMADDGTLLLATRGGAVWQSQDGAETWEIMGQGPPCAIHALVPVPGFAQTPAVVLGTQLGIWFSAGGDFQPTPWLERLEQGGVFLSCGDPDGYCATYTNHNAGAGGGLDLGAGDSVRFATEGVLIRVLAEGGGEWEAIVDGEPHSPESGQIELSEDGWKNVEIVVHAGELRIDAIEVRGEGDVMNLDYQPSSDTDTGGKEAEKTAGDSRCGGCSTDDSQGGWPFLALLPTLLMLTRRNQPSRR